jgi:hypothetical protein
LVLGSARRTCTPGSSRPYAARRYAALPPSPRRSAVGAAGAVPAGSTRGRNGRDRGWRGVAPSSARARASSAQARQDSDQATARNRWTARARAVPDEERERERENDVLLLTVSPPPAASARYRPRLAGDGIWRAAWLSGDVGRFGPRPDVLST